jgi:hypothetical protein
MGSKVPEIGDKFEKLPAVLAEYDKALEDIEKQIEIKGKGLEGANMENPTWQSYYDQKRIELKTLTDFMDLEVSRVRGKLFRKYKESHSRELNEREINQYINNEEAYLIKYQMYLEVKEMLQKYQAVVDAFTTRGYALNNITKARVASLEDVIL